MSDITPADLKALLAKHGQTLNPDAEMVYLDFPPKEGTSAVVVLERVRENYVPDYCTHGYATCTRCHFPCWIGHATQEVLVNREAWPICVECAADVVPPNSKPIRHVEDHKRADGPHE